MFFKQGAVQLTGVFISVNSVLNLLGFYPSENNQETITRHRVSTLLVCENARLASSVRDSSLWSHTTHTHTHTHTPFSWLPWRCCDREKEYGHLQPPAMSSRQETCPWWSLGLYICSSCETHYPFLSPLFIPVFLFPYLSSLSRSHSGCDLNILSEFPSALSCLGWDVLFCFFS